jgi:hypothetical protein
MPIVVSSTSTVSALDIIKRAMRLLGVYAIGEDPSAEEAQDGLSALNALMDSLSNSPLLVFARTEDEIAIAAGTATLTVGPSGDTVTDRPVRVLGSSYYEIGGVSYPLDLLTLDQFNAIGDKTTTGLPTAMYAQMGMPDATVYLWPVPEQAVTLHLWSDKQFNTFDSLTEEVSLPPGYNRMLAFLLAIDLAPEFQVDPPPAVIRGAAAARRALKRTNLEVPVLDIPAGVPGSPGFRDIREF